MLKTHSKCDTGDIYSFSFDYISNEVTLNVIQPLDTFNGWVKGRMSDGKSQAAVYPGKIIYWIDLSDVVGIYEETSELEFSIDGVTKPVGPKIKEYILKGMRAGLKQYYREIKIGNILK